MLLSFDPAKENGRYEQFADARKRALAAREARKSNPGETLIVENPVTTRLLEIDKDIAAKSYQKAAADLRALLDKNPSEARVYYNIGRVASLSAAGLDDPSEQARQRELLVEAKVAFENVIRIATAQRTDPALVSLSYVALAKIYEFYGDKTYAIGIYDAAIKIGPVAGGAHNEAIAAKARLIKEQ
jgi:tetratricopeptide (TPR) repeat protein